MTPRRPHNSWLTIPHPSLAPAPLLWHVTTLSTLLGTCTAWKNEGEMEPRVQRLAVEHAAGKTVGTAPSPPPSLPIEPKYTPPPAPKQNSGNERDKRVPRQLRSGRAEAHREGQPPGRGGSRVAGAQGLGGRSRHQKKRKNVWPCKKKVRAPV